MPWRRRRNRPHGQPTTRSTLIRRLTVDIPIGAARRRVSGGGGSHGYCQAVVIVANRPCNVARFYSAIARPVGVIGRRPWRRRGQIAADCVRLTELVQRFGPRLAVSEAISDNLVDFSGLVDQELLELPSGRGERPRGFESPPIGGSLLDLSLDGVETLPRGAVMLDSTAQHRLKLAVRRRRCRQSLDQLGFPVQRRIGESTEDVRHPAKATAAPASAIQI